MMMTPTDPQNESNELDKKYRSLDLEPLFEAMNFDISMDMETCRDNSESDIADTETTGTGTSRSDTKSDYTADASADTNTSRTVNTEGKRAKTGPSTTRKARTALKRRFHQSGASSDSEENEVPLLRRRLCITRRASM